MKPDPAKFPKLGDNYQYLKETKCYTRGGRVPTEIRKYLGENFENTPDPELPDNEDEIKLLRPPLA